MSLTKNDLQAIGNLIDERLEIKLESKLEEKLESKFEEKLGPIRSDLKTLKKKVNKIDWTVNYISKTFDERIVQDMKDIKIIKSHIGLPSKN